MDRKQHNYWRYGKERKFRTGHIKFDKVKIGHGHNIYYIELCFKVKFTYNIETKAVK